MSAPSQPALTAASRDGCESSFGWTVWALVGDERAEPALHERFERLRTNADMAAERERIAPYMDAEPDKTLAFLAEMDMDAPEGDTPTVYACPHAPACGQR